MQQADHHQGPHDRQRDAARERKDAGEQQQFEATDVAEVLRPPFSDPGERGAEAERRQRHQQRFRPMRRQAGRGDGKGHKRQPPQQHARPLGALFAQQCLEHRRSDQAERQHHAAVQIAPQHQKRQGPIWRRAAAIHAADQRSRPGHHQRQHQHMWPCQHVRRQQDYGRDHHEQRQGWRKLAQQEEREKGEGERDRRGRDGDDAWPAGQRVYPGIDDLGKPFERDPGRAMPGKRKRVARRQGAVCDDPPPELNVRIAVGITEQPRPGDQQHSINGEPHDPRERRTCRKRLNRAVNDLVSHGGPK